MSPSKPVTRIACVGRSRVMFDFFLCHAGVRKDEGGFASPRRSFGEGGLSLFVSMGGSHHSAIFGITKSENGAGQARSLNQVVLFVLVTYRRGHTRSHSELGS